MIVVKEHEHNASLGREPVIGAKDWRILRFNFIRNKLPRDQLLGIDEAMMGGMDITTGHQLDIADYNDFSSSTREWSIDLSTDAGKVIQSSIQDLSADNVLDNISRITKSLSGNPLLPTPIVNLGPSVMGISILGAPLLGKTRLALKLGQKFRMEVISIPATLKKPLILSKARKRHQLQRISGWGSLAKK